MSCKLEASLHEIALHSPQPSQLAEFYCKALGYEFEDSENSLLGLARGRRLRLLGGEPGKLAYAAYALADPESLKALQSRLGSAGIQFEKGAFAGFQEAVCFADPIGNQFVFGLSSELVGRCFKGTANRVARLQHVVFASTDISRLLSFFTDVVGFALTDRVLDDDGGLRTVFLRCSEEHHSLAIFASSEDRLDHHCFEAGGWNLIRDWGDHFADCRVPIKWGPGRHGPGNNLFLFIHDLDGNWLEISAELENVDDGRPVGNWPHEERTLNSWGSAFLRS
jgi:catechol 2,3-dioxygenase